MRRVVLSRMFDLLERTYGTDFGREQFVALSVHEIDGILSFKFDQHLDDLRGALDRIEDGTFGFCLGCKREIGQETLDGDPARRMCTFCEEEFNRPVLHTDLHELHQ